MTATPDKSKRYARPAATCKHIQVSAATLWQWVKTRPGFPQPIKAGPRVTLFDLNAIEAFLDQSSGK